MREKKKRSSKNTTYVHSKELDSVLEFPTRSVIVSLGTSIDFTAEQ